MKKSLFVLFLFTSVLAFGQDTKPVSANFKQLQTPNNPAFYYFTTDSSVWVYKGTYGWTKLANANKKYSIWNHTGINNTGWATGNVLKFDAIGNLIPGSVTGGTGIALTDLFGDSPITYNNTTGHFSIGTSYTVPTAVEKGHYDTAYGWGDHSGLYKTLSDSTATTGFTRRDRLASQISTRVPISRTITATAPITIAGTTSADLTANRTIAITQSGTGSNGYLSSTDWNTFNNKQPSGSYLVAADIAGKKDIVDSTSTTGYTRRDRLASQIATRVTKNANITGATKTKITYDVKGLVTAGADATTADIAASTNKNYVTDAQAIVIGNTSGSNSGDNAVNSNYSGLVSNATHTGDATGATALSVVKIQGKSFPTLGVGDDGKYPKYDNGTNAFIMTAVSSGSMTWPLGSGIPIVSTGSSWGTTISDNSINWNKYNQWDGGSTGLTATTGRTSLGITGDIYTHNSSEYAASSHPHGNITNAGYIGTTATLPVITGTGGILQAGSFGTSAGTFAQGNDSRINNGQTAYGWGDHSGLYTPIGYKGMVGIGVGGTPGYLSSTGFANVAGTIELSGVSFTNHVHGNISNDGKIGTTTALPIITTTAGLLTTGSFGTASGSFAQGNDSRINNGQTAYGWGNHSGLYVAASLTGKVSADNGSSFGYLKSSDFTNTLGDISPNIKTINSTAVIGSGNFTLAQLAGSLTQNFNVATLGIEAGANDWSVAGSAGVLNFTSYAASVSFGTTGIISAANFQLSDRRLKQNIKPITFSNSDQIRFVQFDMKADSTHRTRYGVIAQEVEKIMPEVVYTDSKGMKSVNYIDLLISKIAELEERIKALENEK